MELSGRTGRQGLQWSVWLPLSQLLKAMYVCTLAAWTREKSWSILGLGSLWHLWGIEASPTAVWVL